MEVILGLNLSFVCTRLRFLVGILEPCVRRSKLPADLVDDKTWGGGERKEGGVLPNDPLLEFPG